jgi:hypothetical protein
MKYVLISALTVLLASCGGSKETTITTSDGKDITIKQTGDGESATITAKGENGEVGTLTTGAAAAGSALPAGVATYPGAKNMMTMSGNEGGKSGGMAVLETSDAPEKVIAFYKAEAARKGLTKDVSETTSNSNGEAMSTYSAKSEDGTGLMVAVGTKDGKTSITIMGGKE